MKKENFARVLFAALVPGSVAGQGGVAADGEAVADKQRLVQALAAGGDLAGVGVAVTHRPG